MLFGLFGAGRVGWGGLVHHPLPPHPHKATNWVIIICSSSSIRLHSLHVVAGSIEGRCGGSAKLKLNTLSSWTARTYFVKFSLYLYSHDMASSNFRIFQRFLITPSGPGPRPGCARYFRNPLWWGGTFSIPCIWCGSCWHNHVYYQW